MPRRVTPRRVAPRRMLPEERCRETDGTGGSRKKSMVEQPDGKKPAVETDGHA